MIACHRTSGMKTARLAISSHTNRAVSHDHLQRSRSCHCDSKLAVPFKGTQRLSTPVCCPGMDFSNRKDSRITFIYSNIGQNAVCMPCSERGVGVRRDLPQCPTHVWNNVFADQAHSYSLFRLVPQIGVCREAFRCLPLGSNKLIIKRKRDS